VSYLSGYILYLPRFWDSVVVVGDVHVEFGEAGSSVLYCGECDWLDLSTIERLLLM